MPAQHTLPTEDAPFEHPLRLRFRQDLQLAALSHTSIQSYLAAVDLFLKRTWLDPEHVTEQHLTQYLRALQQAPVAEGTFKVARHALFFLFQNTLQRPWPLFQKKSATPGN